MAFSWSAKDPDEEYEYTHDWAARLTGDDELVLIGADEPTMEVTVGDVEVTAIVPVPASAQIQYWLRAGTVKSELVATVKTTEGRTYQERFKLPIKER